MNKKNAAQHQYVGPALSSWPKAILTSLDASKLDDTTKKVVIDSLSSHVEGRVDQTKYNRHSLRAARSWLRRAYSRAANALMATAARRVRRPGAYQRMRPKAKPWVNVKASFNEQHRLITNRIQTSLTSFDDEYKLGAQ